MPAKRERHPRGHQDGAETPPPGNIKDKTEMNDKLNKIYQQLCRLRDKHDGIVLALFTADNDLPPELENLARACADYLTQLNLELSHLSSKLIHLKPFKRND